MFQAQTIISTFSSVIAIFYTLYLVERLHVYLMGKIHSWTGRSQKWFREGKASNEASMDANKVRCIPNQVQGGSRWVGFYEQEIWGGFNQAEGSVGFLWHWSPQPQEATCCFQGAMKLIRFHNILSIKGCIIISKNISMALMMVERI